MLPVVGFVENRTLPSGCNSPRGVGGLGDGLGSGSGGGGPLIVRLCIGFSKDLADADAGTGGGGLWVGVCWLFLVATLFALLLRGHRPSSFVLVVVVVVVLLP